MTALERVVARDEIRQLACRYALAIDSRDIDSLVSLFVPDVRVGRHASGRVYCRGQIQDGEKWIEQAIQYRDTNEQRDGEWLFVRRVHVLWYGVETAERPLDQEPANWPERHVGRGTVPEDIPSWNAFWRERGRS